MNLNAKQLSVIQHALSIARERFLEDAKVCDDVKQPRIAMQFRLQAAEAFEVYNYLDDAQEVGL